MNIFGTFQSIAKHNVGKKSKSSSSWSMKSFSASTDGCSRIVCSESTVICFPYTANDNTYVNVSTDGGTTWTKYTGTNIVPKNTINCLCYGKVNGSDMFVGSNSSGQSTRFMRSTNGYTWTTFSSPANLTYKAICYGNGLFVAFGQSGTTTNTVYTSSDATTWTSQTVSSGLSNKYYSCCCYGLPSNNGLYVALNNVGTGITSSDGTNWTQQTIVSGNWTGVCWGKDKFVAVGLLGKICTSADGITWTSQTSGTTLDFYSIAYGDDIYFALTWDGSAGFNTNKASYYSLDGITWSSKTLNSRGAGEATVYVKSSNTFITSITGSYTASYATI